MSRKDRTVRTCLTSQEATTIRFVIAVRDKVMIHQIVTKIHNRTEEISNWQRIQNGQNQT